MLIRIFTQNCDSNVPKLMGIHSDASHRTTIFRWPDSDEGGFSWYYRAIGEDGEQLLALEIANGRLQSVEYVIGNEASGIVDATRSMERVELDCHPILALEALQTEASQLIHRGVDVKTNVQISSLSDKLLVGFDFMKARRVFSVGGKIAYFTTEQMQLVGLEVRF